MRHFSPCMPAMGPFCVLTCHAAQQEGLGWRGLGLGLVDWVARDVVVLGWVQGLLMLMMGSG